MHDAHLANFLQKTFSDITFIFVSTSKCKDQKVDVWVMGHLVTQFQGQYYAVRTCLGVRLCPDFPYLKSVQNMINVFERWCYRGMLRISWTEHVTNEEVINRANTKPTLLDGVLKRRLAFHGHLVRKGGITLDL